MTEPLPFVSSALPRKRQEVTGLSLTAHCHWRPWAQVFAIYTLFSPLLSYHLYLMDISVQLLLLGRTLRSGWCKSAVLRWFSLAYKQKERLHACECLLRIAAALAVWVTVVQWGHHRWKLLSETDWALCRRVICELDLTLSALCNVQLAPCGNRSGHCHLMSSLWLMTQNGEILHMHVVLMTTQFIIDELSPSCTPH